MLSHKDHAGARHAERPGVPRHRRARGTSSYPRRQPSATRGLLDHSRPQERRRARREQPSWHPKIRLALTVTDVAVIVLALVLAGDVRYEQTSSLEVQDRQVPAVVIGLVIAAIWAVALGATRSRNPRILTAGLEEYRAVLDGTVMAFGVVAVAAYLLQIPLSRHVFLLALPIGSVLLLLERWIWRQAMLARRKRGRFLEKTLIVGRRADVVHFAREIERNFQLAIDPVAVCYLDGPPLGDEDPLDAAARRAGVESIERVEWRDVARRAWASDVHCIAVAGDLPGGRETLRRLSWQLEGAQVDLVIVSRLTDVAGPRIHLRRVEGLPLMYVSLPQFSGVAHVVKRAMDIVISLLVLVLASPLYLAIAIAIKLDDGGPVFFRQERVGLGGRLFRIWKFRTMVQDAASRVTELADAGANEGAGVLFKMKKDPRVTRVGQLLRKASLDELPQFLNVLGGSMSAVGPRPPLPSEVAQYSSDVTRRLLLRPGITGLWQVSGRSNLSWEDSVRLDLSYVENWSITGDLTIMVRTVVAVLRRDGAY
ncbi:sugar transferase [Salana multivorans]